MKQLIEFKKQRELGDILTDTFGFIRNEFKPFFKAIINIAGPYILFFLFSMIFYIYMVGDQFNFGLQDSGNVFPFKNFAALIPAYLFYFVSAILAYTYTSSTVLHYIKSYIKNEGEINLEDIKNNVKQTFWSYLGLSFIKGITLVFAMLICCLPIFYFIVPMMVVLPILVFKDMDVTESYSYSFTLIKEEFWITLATIVVFGIIIMVLGGIFSIPTAMYTWLKMGVFSGEIDPVSMDSLVDPIYILLNVISSFFQFALNLIFDIGAVLIYFNLNERKNFTGTMERIESIGNTTD